MYSGVYSDVYSGVYFGVYSDVYPGVYSDVYSAAPPRLSHLLDLLTVSSYSSVSGVCFTVFCCCCRGQKQSSS